MMKRKYSALLFVLFSAALGLAGCTGYYSAYPGYGPYYNTGPYYGGPAPAYAYPGAVTVEVGDRPYYTHGPGYYVGRNYYVWKRGHWAVRNGHKVWIHGHYVVRG
jgi:WXXGXW repeat (2 copies)